MEAGFTQAHCPEKTRRDRVNGIYSTILKALQNCHKFSGYKFLKGGQRLPTPETHSS